jgi:two-component system alkaline phosphatase synthesis response regulator PhoP
MEAAQKQPLVLLVDDEPEILDLYSFSLKEAGFDIITAPNGQEALRIAREKQPQLVLMDVKMPVMDGVEACMKLKEDPATKAIKVVFLTAFSDPNHPEVDLALAKGIDAMDYIRKGISLDEFVVKVRGYLRQ